MPRRKRPTLCPWSSANLDNREKRFVQLGYSLYFAEPYRSLNGGARHLYSCMILESAGHRQFYFPESIAKKYGIAPTTFWKYVKELEAARFIKVYSRKNLRQPNLYEFCLDWKLPPSPSAKAPPMAIYSISGQKRHSDADS